MANLDLLLEAEKRGILPPDKQALLAEARSRGLVPSTPESSDKPGILSKVGAGLLGAAFPPAGTSSVLNEFLTKQPFGSTSPLDVAKNGALTTAAAANTLLAGIPGDLAPQGLQQQYAQALQNNPGPALLGPGTGAALQTMLTGGSGQGLLGTARQIGAAGLGGYSQVANNPNTSFEQRGTGALLGAGTAAALKGLGYAGDQALQSKFGQDAAQFIENKVPFLKSLNLTKTSKELLQSSGQKIGDLTQGNPNLIPLPKGVTADDLEAMASRVANSPIPEMTGSYDKFMQAAQNARQLGGHITVEDAQFLKSKLWGKALTNAGLLKPGDTAEGYNALSQYLRGQLGTELGSEYNTATNTYANASNIAKALGKRPNIIKNLVAASTALGGAAGVASGHKKLGILGLLLGGSALNPAIANTLVQGSNLAPQLSQLPPALLQLLQGQ